MATFLAVSVFVVSVVAALRISAELSGSFNFNVPSGDFFLSIEASSAGNKGPALSETFNFDEINNFAERSWDLNGLSFEENERGEIIDIVFTFKVTNKNTDIGTRTGGIKISYLLEEIDPQIELFPSENIEFGLELAPQAFDELDQEDNKAEITVTLSSKNKTYPSNFAEAGFKYKLIFEFI